MATWLYQMRANQYSTESYRKEIWEGQNIVWPTRRIQKGLPESGDIAILFYVRTGAPKDCGLYGWGVILRYKIDSKEIVFRPTNPSDALKMNPLWDNEIDEVIREIQGKFAQWTMKKINDEHSKKLRDKISGIHQERKISRPKK